MGVEGMAPGEEGACAASDGRSARLVMEPPVGTKGNFNKYLTFRKGKIGIRWADFAKRQASTALVWEEARRRKRGVVGD